MDSSLQNNLKIIGFITALILLLLGFWVYSDFFLLLFGGILWGVGLSGMARFGTRYAPVPYPASLAASLLLLLAAVSLVVWQVGPMVVEGLETLQSMIPDAVKQLRSKFRDIGIFKEISDRMSSISAEASLISTDSFSRLLGVFSTTIGIITAMLFILLTGIYFAVKPEIYQKGIEHLVVPRQRGYAREVLQELTHTLRWWLLGRLLALAVVGVLTWLGLFALGIEAAITLAVVAALLSFIPNIGPLLSLIPAALVGWAQSPTMALWVILLYLAIQTVESYLITPLIQQSNLEIPPALLLSAQFLAGLMFGILGLLLATPLMVVILVLVQMLYVRSVLKDPIDLP